MNRDEVLLLVYNKKVKRTGKIYSIWDPVMGNIPVSSYIAFFIAEEWMDSNLVLSKEGKQAVADAMKRRMQNA